MRILFLPGLLLAATLAATSARAAPQMIPVANASFEEDADRNGKPDGWSYGDNDDYAHLAETSSEARDGKSSLKLVNWRDTWAYHSLPLKHLPDGEVISVACWAKLKSIEIKDDDDAWKVFRIYLEIKDERDSKTEHDIVKLTEKKDWQWYTNEKKITVPKGYKEAKIVVTFNALAGEALIDRIVVVRGTELPPETISAAAQVGTRAEVLKSTITRVRQAIAEKNVQQSPLEAVTEAQSRISAAVLLAEELEREALRYSADSAADADKVAELRRAVATIKGSIRKAIDLTEEAKAIHRNEKDFSRAEQLGSEKTSEALAALAEAEVAAETAEFSLVESMVLAASWGGGLYRAKQGAPHDWEEANTDNPLGFAVFLAADSQGALYAGGTDKLLYDSQDNGKTWSSTPTMLPVVPSSMAIDQQVPGRWLIASWGGGLWSSKDEGRNWTEVKGSPRFSRGLLSVRAAGSRLAYFLIDDAGSVLAAPGAGGPWKELARMPQGVQAWDLEVKPGKDDVLLAATNVGIVEISPAGKVSFLELEAPTANARAIAIDGSRVLIGTWGDGIVEWKPLAEETPRANLINKDVDNRAISAIVVSRNPKPELADEAAFIQGPRVWTNRGTGLGGAKVNGVAVNPLDEKVMYCTTDGGVFKSEDAGANWEGSMDGLVGLRVGRIVINPSNPDILYLAPAYIDNPAGIQKSTDGGDNWVQKNSGLGGALAAMWVELDKSNPNVLYMISWGGGAYRSDNGADSWQAIPEGLPSINGYCIVVGSEDPMHVFAGMRGVGLYRFDTTAWEWVEAGRGVASADVWHVAQNPFDGTTWMAGTPGSGLFKSTDGGKTWRQVSKGLTVNTIYRIVYHPQKSGVVYIGSKATTGGGAGGIFRSADGGETWAPDNQGLPALDIQDIAITSHGLVYAATASGLFYKQD